MIKTRFNLFFSSGGNLLHYYLGYGSIIQNYYKNLFPQKKLNIGGVSAGSFAGSFLAYDVNIGQVYPDWNRKISEKLKNSSYYQITNNFTEVTQPYFQDKKPIHDFHMFTSKINVTNFNLFGKSIPLCKLNLTSENFIGCNSKPKLFNSITASCYLPVFGPTLCYQIDSNYYLDGVFSFDPNAHQIDKFICYTNQIQNIGLLDKYPSYDHKSNLELFNIGKLTASKIYGYLG